MRHGVSLAVSIMLFAGAAAASGQAHDMGAMGSMTVNTMMPGHMTMTPARPIQAGDQAKADAVALAAKAAIAPYMDYKKALNDGWIIFMPKLPQKIYHFTNYTNGYMEQQRFDATKPTSLLYEKTADGGYKLVGAMYTDRKDAPESELNERIPLSIGRWHEHVNFCKAPAGEEKSYFGKDAKFGLMGSITTKNDCDAAGGAFQPNLFGWMVHVYPFESDAKKVWATDRDDDDHDHMHSDMKGMKM